MRALPWQYSRNQNVLGSSPAPVRADYVSCRHVSLVVFGSSASGLYAPIAPSHALISMAAADTFLRLTSPSPQGVNKECSEMLWACVCMQILKLLVQSLLLLLNVFLSRLFFFKAFSFKAFCSKRFLQIILKDIKGSRNQTSCCETLTRRNLSATKSATYVHLVFPKI